MREIVIREFANRVRRKKWLVVIVEKSRISLTVYKTLILVEVPVVKYWGVAITNAKKNATVVLAILVLILQSFK